MKKQFLILATITTIVFTSCSKEKTETQQPGNFEEVATAKKPGGGNSFTPVSNKGLLGRFEFNNNLKDATGQLADGVSTVNRVLYTTDRKGVADRAIRFNEAYGVDIFDVPSSPEATVSVWVRHEVILSNYWNMALMSWKGFSLQNHDTTFVCSYFTGTTDQTVYATSINDKWHHLAATRDNSELRFYVDGVFVGSSPTPAGVGPFPSLDNYLVGYGMGTFWKGALDDLRFYERVLSAAEINTLANL